MRTVFYDDETTSQFAPYCDLTVVGLLWDDGKEEIFNWPPSQKDFEYLRNIFADPTIKKVGFNNSNFDDLVQYRHGMPVEETNREDAYLAVKTLFPELPAFSQKFLCWWFFGDFHWPEYELEKSQKWQGNKGKFEDANNDLLVKYNSHDLRQLKQLWEFLAPLLVDRAAKAYALDMSQGKVIEQMIFKGGLYIDEPRCQKMLHVLTVARERNMTKATLLSEGKVKKSSGKALGEYFDAEGFILELTDNGNFQFDKKAIEFIYRLHPVARCIKNVRKIDSILKYYRNYLKAIEDCTYRGTKPKNWLPTSFSISGARTRRYTSSSRYGLNFQNPNEFAKQVQIAPPGWLPFWIDSTQVENIVHIYESNDTARRRAYEADPNWSEYVWLCNEIMQTDLSKKQLDKIKSKVNELWSVYKQYKTIKLMMNFGAGVKKFASVSGFPFKEAQRLFKDIHQACPAIHDLQNRVKADIERYGEVYDPFGHVYRGTPDFAYKIVAYLIQGCGTASLPKAQLRANYDTLQNYNSLYWEDVGVLALTTHDECAGYIDLSIGKQQIDDILQDLMYNMTEKFSPMFDDIPLRAKLFLSTTSNAKRKECNSYSHFLTL